MSGIVLDASVTAAWVLADESNPQAAAVLALLNDSETFVPYLWHFEMRNILLIAERRGRLFEDDAVAGLRYLRGLPIATDQEAEMDAAYALAKTHGLSFYDALYLELAKRRGASLATLDSKMALSAALEGIQSPTP